MSTRCSSFYKNGLHLYWESSGYDLCLDWFCNCEPHKDNRNERYDSFTMSLDDWEELANDILADVKSISEMRKRLEGEQHT